MDQRFLFSEALKIADPWYVEDISFDPMQHRLNIHIDWRGVKINWLNSNSAT
jgi:hypothetical protein